MARQDGVKTILAIERHEMSDNMNTQGINAQRYHSKEAMGKHLTEAKTIRWCIMD